MIVVDNFLIYWFLFWIFFNKTDSISELLRQLSTFSHLYQEILTERNLRSFALGFFIGGCRSHSKVRR